MFHLSVDHYIEYGFELLIRGVQSGYRFGFGSVFSVFRLVKYNYHSKSIFTSVRFGLYTVGFRFIRFYTKKHNYLV